MEKMQKAFPTDVKVVEGERAVMATISTSAVDRDGEVLIPQGCNAKDYQKNPIICLNHSYYALPIGKCVALQREENAVVAKIVFAKRPDDHPIGEEWVPDTIFSLFQQGVLNAFSVGFMPLESRPATQKDLERFGESCRRVFSKWSLLEVSVVPIPANQEAVAMAVSKGAVSMDVATKLFGDDIEWAQFEKRDDGEVVQVDGITKQPIEADSAVEAKAVGKKVQMEISEPAPSQPAPRKIAIPLDDYQPQSNDVIDAAIQKHRGRIYLA